MEDMYTNSRIATHFVVKQSIKSDPIMHYAPLPLPKALAGLVAALGVSALSSFAQDIPANTAVSPPLNYPGGSLKGEYWKRPLNTIATDGAGNRADGIDNQINTFGAPSGIFTGQYFNFSGNDLTKVSDFLQGDGPSYSGIASNLDDGAFRMKGYINVTTAGPVNIGTTSDDGSRIKISGIDIINNDGCHGGQAVNATANFLAAGL